LSPALNILIADDDEADLLLLRRAFLRVEPYPQLRAVNNGSQLLDYLSGKAPYDDEQRYPLPDLIIMDLTLPRVTGFEVLEFMKSHRNLRDIPVCILTGNDNPAHKERATILGACCYYLKTGVTEDLANILRAVTTKCVQDGCGPGPEIFRPEQRQSERNTRPDISP
jgi:CheY-like chemotaxis protein